MSTRCSFGYESTFEGAPHNYHLYEDFHDPGVVFVEVPRDCLDEMDSETVTLRFPPALWEAIRQHACPNHVPADWKPPTPEQVRESLEKIGRLHGRGS